MKKIVVKLVECGFSFSFEQKHSNGEIIRVDDVCLEIESKEGIIYFDFEGDLEEASETEKNYDYFCRRIEQIMIDETSSF